MTLAVTEAQPNCPAISSVGIARMLASGSVGTRALATHLAVAGRAFRTWPCDRAGDIVSDWKTL